MKKTSSGLNWILICNLSDLCDTAVTYKGLLTHTITKNDNFLHLLSHIKHMLCCFFFVITHPLECLWDH